jgi:hypothetical protein
MTDEELAAIEARLSAAVVTEGRSVGAIQVGKKELRRAAPRDLRRLLDEVQRLRAEGHATCQPEAWAAAAGVARALRAERDAARSECAALTAKAEAIRALPPEPRCNHEGDCSDWSHGWESGRNATLREVGRIFDDLPPLRDYSGMPHTPAQGCTCHPTDPSTWTRYGDAVEPGSMWEPDPDCPEHGAHSEILPAQEGRGDAETLGTGSGRGTGVREPQKPAQATEGWYEFIHPTKATTHIAHFSEGGQVYLPEADLTEEDFYLAAASNRFWRLVRDLASLPVEEGP